MLADEQTSPEQFESFRKLTGEQRLQIAEELYWQARELKATGLRALNPDWPDSRVAAAVRRIFSDGRA